MYFLCHDYLYYMTKEIFLILNLALAFYNVGTIWAHEVDIFRTWKLLDPETFLKVQTAHWRKLPYWVFIPVVLSLAGGIALLWYHPAAAQLWQIWLALSFQLLSHLLTALFWGRWQAKLSRDKSGGASRYLKKILNTHWIRTLLISAYGLMLLWMVVENSRVGVLAINLSKNMSVKFHFDYFVSSHQKRVHFFSTWT